METELTILQLSEIMNNTSLEQIYWLRLMLRTGTLEKVADWLVDRVYLVGRLPLVVSHINLYNYYLLWQDPVSLEKVRKHYVCLFDGIGMKIGAALSGYGWTPDLNGTDLFPLMMNRAEKRRLSVFFLGAAPNILAHAIENTLQRWPNLKCCGSRDGYFLPDKTAEIARQVRASGAQILLISMGSSMHTDFILKYRSEFGATLIWNVGGLFDFLGGAKPRAPRWIRRLRLEWAFRLLLEPRRMWKRTFVAAPWFYMHLLKCKFHPTLYRNKITD